MKKSRILIVVLNARLVGGLETVGRDVALSLRRLGHEVSVVSALESSQSYVGWGDVPVRAIAPANPLLLRLYFRVWRWILALHLRRVRHDYDLVLIMHPYAAASAYRAGVPCYWVWVHGIEVWGEWSTWLKTGLQQARRVVAVSNYTHDIVKTRLPVQTVEIIPNVVDITRFTPAEPPRIPEPPYRLLTVGRLAAAERYKGHDRVIRNLGAIIRRVTFPVEYWIVGDGDDRSRLENLAQECGVADKVRFWGRVPDDQLVALYQACDVFVMPSVVERRPDGSWAGEGFGIVYLEASACGKPVVAGNAGGAVDAVEDGVTGYCIDPTSDEALVCAVSRLLSDPELARRMGMAGRQRVEREFSPVALDRDLMTLIGVTE